MQYKLRSRTFALCMGYVLSFCAYTIADLGPIVENRVLALGLGMKYAKFYMQCNVGMSLERKEKADGTKYTTYKASATASYTLVDTSDPLTAAPLPSGNDIPVIEGVHPYALWVLEIRNSEVLAAGSPAGTGVDNITAANGERIGHKFKFLEADLETPPLNPETSDIHYNSIYFRMEPWTVLQVDANGDTWWVDIVTDGNSICDTRDPALLI